MGTRPFQDALIHGSLPAAIIAVDPALGVFAFNPAAESFFGLESPRALARPLADLKLPGIDQASLDAAKRRRGSDPGDTCRSARRDVTAYNVVL